MFTPISVPFDSKMLFNVVRLKPGVKMEDVELALGEMCNVVKNQYGNEEGGFIAGQVFKYAGFVSAEGSINAQHEGQKDHIVIVTYWKSFPQHEASHADETFKVLFNKIGEMCEETYELGYDLLWQGEPEGCKDGECANK